MTPAPDQPRYWFPAETYGWGWGLPITWEGWVVLVGVSGPARTVPEGLPATPKLARVHRQRARALRPAYRDLLVEGRASEVAVGMREHTQQLQR